VSTLLTVARNEWRQIWRDKWYLALMTIGAVGALITLAYTLSTDIEDVTTLIVNLDSGQHGRRFVQALDNDALFALDLVAQRQDAARRLREDTAKVAVIIPTNYSRCIDRGQAVAIQVLVDGSKPGVAELARNHLTAIAGSISQELAAEKMARLGGPPPTPPGFRPRVRYNAELKTVVSVAPGLMAIVLIVPAVGASSAFARERERGSFEAIISTPVGRWPLLLGRILPYVLIGLFDIGVFTAVGYFIFEVPIRGELGSFVVLGLFYIFATCSSGVFIAQFMRTQHAATIVTFMLFSITPFYLSDIFFPVHSMPIWLHWLSALQPATHFTTAARGILLKGLGWEALWPSAAAILATGITMSALAYARFRKKLA